MLFLSCNTKIERSLLEIESPKEKILSEENNLDQCETCKDSLCIIYARELQLKLGENDSILRDKLTSAFQNVNRLHSSINYGGTFFGHQEVGLLAEVEFSLYRINKNKQVYENGFRQNKIDFLKKWVSYIEKAERENVENKMDENEAKRRFEDFENKLDWFQRNITDQSVLDEVIRFDSVYY